MNKETRAGFSTIEMVRVPKNTVSRNPIVGRSIGGKLVRIVGAAALGLALRTSQDKSNKINSLESTLNSQNSQNRITETVVPTEGLTPTQVAQNPTLEPSPSFTLTPTPTASETSTSTPTQTVIKEEITKTPKKSFDILGTGKVVPDSVWPGGVDIDKDNFSEKEAITVAEIYNGATAQTSTEGNLLKLSAARAFAEKNFGLKGKIDTSSLQKSQSSETEIMIGNKKLIRTSNVYYTASGDGQYNLRFELYEAKTSPDFTYNQIAASDKNPGVAYVNNNSVLKDEVIYVVYVFDENGNRVNILTFRGACGNIGSAIKALPRPTKGATVPPQPTPTNVPGQTPEKPRTKVPPTNIPTQPVLPTQEKPPTNIPTQPAS